MNTINASNARRNFFSIVKNAIKGHQIFRISHSSGNAVIMPENKYRGLIETLELLSIPDFRERIQKSVEQIDKGETFSMDEVLGE